MENIPNNSLHFRKVYSPYKRDLSPKAVIILISLVIILLCVSSLFSLINRNRLENGDVYKVKISEIPSLSSVVGYRKIYKLDGGSHAALRGYIQMYFESPDPIKDALDYTYYLLDNGYDLYHQGKVDETGGYNSVYTVTQTEPHRLLAIVTIVYSKGYDEFYVKAEQHYDKENENSQN